MDIEVCQEAVASLPVTAGLLESLRESARLTATHYSTQIEGNRLTQEQVAVVSKGGTFPNRQRDEIEVRNYFVALDYVDSLIRSAVSDVTPKMIQTIHGCVMEGKERPTPYREGQNVIRESGSGNIVYMPPEWTDVPGLMQELMDWINNARRKAELPAPLIAGIAHYQFATIHPYFDGNGRTARLLTNLILHLSGYGLNGIYSLEEYYAKNLAEYYEAISAGNSHNYYMGRAEADITGWVDYYCVGMAEAFSAVRMHASAIGKQPDQRSLLRELDGRQKLVLVLFREARFVKTKDIAEVLNVQPRMALNICNQWVKSGFLMAEGERKSRRYELAERWVALL